MRSSRSACVRGLILAVAGWLLAQAPLGAAEPFAKSVGDVKVGAVKQGAVLEVPYILWGGDVATFLANGGLLTKEGSIFQKQGLKIKLIPGDDFPKQVKNYVEGQSPFLRGTMSMLGLASEVTGKDERTRPVVFLQLTWSAGDHLVARSGLKTLGDLKGKKLALQQGGPHVGMLDDILRTANLKWSDVKVVWTPDVTGDKGPATLFKKDNGIDACFAITPDMTDLTGGLGKKGTGDKGTVKGAHVLVSTADMKRSIGDVYACRKDYFDAHKDVVEKFAAGYLRACEELVAIRKPFQEKKDAPRYKALLQLTQDIYGKEALKTLDDADGLIADAVFVGLPGNDSFFTEKGNLSGFAPKAKAAVDLAVGQGYAGKRFELLSAGLDYNKLKQLGDLKTNLGEGPAGVLEATQIPKGDDLTDNTLYFFTINFDPNQSKFEEAKYGQDFQRALEQASLFGNSMVAVRGHADLVTVVNAFVKAGISKGILKRVGSPGKYEFFTRDGSKLDLSDTKKIVALIEKEDFSSDKFDPRFAVKELLRLSDKRAEVVRQALLNYAAAKKIVLDKNQIRAVGVGILEPIVPLPRSNAEMGRNRRVEFRIIRIPAEALSARDFDY